MKKCQINSTEAIISYLPETVTPPRKNGELEFHEPWQSRSFGMALALYDKKVYTTWDEFRIRLIKEISIWEKKNANHLDSSDWNYYEHWQEALNQLIVETKVLEKHEINTRTNEFLTGVRDETF
ncbi:nitrile hydratase accessory protein [Priestia megaterium]|nr:nitrile hydratase accessory protein [Priestia megaterium]